MNTVLVAATGVSSLGSLLAFSYALYMRRQTAPPPQQPRPIKESLLGQAEDTKALIELIPEFHRTDALKHIKDLEAKVNETLLSKSTQGIDPQELERTKIHERVVGSIVLAVTFLVFTVICAVVLGTSNAGSHVTNEVSPPTGIVPAPVVPVPIVSRGVENNPTDFSTLRDISIFDLRAWKPVPPDKTTGRVSPANYINYIHIRRNSREAKTFHGHYATSGSVIDLRAITHPYTVQEVRDLPTTAPRDRQCDFHQHCFVIDVDVSGTPVDTEFLIVIEATYWNGFPGDASDAMTYTDADVNSLAELGLFVLFPLDKPFWSDHVTWQCGKDETFREYMKPSYYFKDRDNHFIYWAVQKPAADCHYRVDWKW
ncbi:MAG: hypothetical protein KF773_24685 [Deltaproteobacteria bacterium]|nr:hypothetical protein [Deltaproteobacteria bacterium]